MIRSFLEPWTVHTRQEIRLISMIIIVIYYYQVAAALLVAGPTLTFWIPWQTLFASTSSYPSVVQSARLLV